MNIEIIVAIIGAVLASSGLWGLIQFLINRKDSIGNLTNTIIPYKEVN